MSELAKAKRRIHKLEVCLDDIREMLTCREEEIERFTGDAEYTAAERQTIKAARNRINRTLR